MTFNLIRLSRDHKMGPGFRTFAVSAAYCRNSLNKRLDANSHLYHYILALELEKIK